MVESVISDEVIARLRYSAFIGSASYYVEYTDARLFEVVNDRLRSVFSDAIIKARAGYWLHESVVSTTSGVVYIPARAVTGGLESVAYLYNDEYIQLDGITPREAEKYAAWPNGEPRGYYTDSERIVIVPTPASEKTIKIRYYLRPSKLVTSQSSTTLGANAIRGRIDSVNPSTRAATVNTLPYDYSLSSPAAITTGAAVDVVRPAGWFSPMAVSETCSIAGSVITLAGMSEADFTSAVQVGHYVRAAEQTDWPALPEDFHRLVADAAAVKVLMEIGLSQKAQELSQSATAEFGRFRDLINPRSKSDPRRVRLRPYWMRGP